MANKTAEGKESSPYKHKIWFFGSNGKPSFQVQGDDVKNVLDDARKMMAHVNTLKAPAEPPASYKGVNDDMSY